MQELERLRDELEKQANVRADKSEEECMKEYQKTTAEIVEFFEDLISNKLAEQYSSAEIELQALKLNMFNSMYGVTGNKLYKIKLKKSS